MGKNGKKQAAKLKALRLQAVTATTITPSHTSEEDEADEIVAPEDLEIAINVIQTLVDEPEELAKQRYKGLKRVGWDLGKALAEQGSGSGELGHRRQSRGTWGRW